MSASTGTIQRPMTGGSIVGAVAIGVATLFAVGALAFGAVNLTATKQTATPVPAPKYIDRGGRGDAQAAPAPISPAVVQPARPHIGDSLVNRPDGLVGKTLVGKPGNVTPEFPMRVAHPRRVLAR